MDSNSVRDVVEALLFSADGPLRVQTIADVLGEEVGTKGVNAAIKALNVSYEERGASFSIVEIAGGVQLLTKPEHDAWIRKLQKARQRQRLSRAALETLAIIAYRQPLTRPAIEEIRGVDVGGVLGTLLERGLAKITGRAEGPGRPHLYGTTPAFLDHFGLKSLARLPRLDEIAGELDRQGIAQELARELGEEPEDFDEEIRAAIGREADDGPKGGSEAPSGRAAEGETPDPSVVDPAMGAGVDPAIDAAIDPALDEALGTGREGLSEEAAPEQEGSEAPERRATGSVPIRR